MTRGRLLLVLASLLALAWTSWLAYEAWTTADPIVVSRPQIMAAPLIVVAELQGEAEPRLAHVTKVYRGQELLGADPDPAKKLAIHVRGLPGTPPGSYILPLRETEVRMEFEVMPTPASPGFASAMRNERARIYPVTPSTELQVRNALRQIQRAVQ
jgi:hypothetical protein